MAGRDHGPAGEPAADPTLPGSVLTPGAATGLSQQGTSIAMAPAQVRLASSPAPWIRVTTPSGMAQGTTLTIIVVLAALLAPHHPLI